jgi:hypothetical protein
LFFRTFHGFAVFGFGSVDTIHCVALVRVNHEKFAGAGWVGVLHGQKMPFGFRKKKNGEIRIASA